MSDPVDLTPWGDLADEVHRYAEAVERSLPEVVVGTLAASTPAATVSSPLRRALAVAAAVIVLVPVVMLAVRWSRGDGASTLGTGSGRRPNVLVIMADDQTLASMAYMRRTLDVVGAAGTVFSNYYVSFPNCCPSRATYLTGQYAHNNGVRDNVLPLGGWSKLKAGETLPVWLQRAGYATAHVGKYLNTWGQKDDKDKLGQGDISPPPGYDHWFGLIDPTTYNYYDYAVSVNGQRFMWGNKPEDYQTDVLGQEVVNTVTRFGKESKPWFVSFTPLAPHTGGGTEAGTGVAELWSFPVPAKRHEGMFREEPVSRGPAWNEADVSKKPKVVRDQKPIDANFDATEIDTTRRELETLQALDEWVDKIVGVLADTGQLDNTVIIYTSDNGQFHGEHRIPFGKVKLYEEASHVPFMIRGPGIPAGRVAEQFVGNVDLAATVAGVTGARPPEGYALDGRSVVPLASDGEAGKNRALLLENWITYTSDQTWALRGGQWYYSVFSNGDRELYDMATDPYQVTNLVDDPAYGAVVKDLAARLDKLKSCAGASCEDSDASRAR